MTSKVVPLGAAVPSSIASSSEHDGALSSSAVGAGAGLVLTIALLGGKSVAYLVGLSFGWAFLFALVIYFAEMAGVYQIFRLVEKRRPAPAPANPSKRDRAKKKMDIAA